MKRHIPLSKSSRKFISQELSSGRNKKPITSAAIAKAISDKANYENTTNTDQLIDKVALSMFYSKASAALEVINFDVETAKDYFVKISKLKLTASQEVVANYSDKDPLSWVTRTSVQFNDDDLALLSKRDTYELYLKYRTLLQEI